MTVPMNVEEPLGADLLVWRRRSLRTSLRGLRRWWGKTDGEMLLDWDWVVMLVGFREGLVWRGE